MNWHFFYRWEYIINVELNLSRGLVFVTAKRNYYGNGIWRDWIRLKRKNGLVNLSMMMVQWQVRTKYGEQKTSNEDRWRDYCVLGLYLFEDFSNRWTEMFRPIPFALFRWIKNDDENLLFEWCNCGNWITAAHTHSHTHIRWI